MSILLAILSLVTTTGIIHILGLLPVLKGSIFFVVLSLVVLFLSLLLYVKLRRMTGSEIFLTLFGLVLGSLAGLLVSLPLLILSYELKPVAFLFISSLSLFGTLYGFRVAQGIALSEIFLLIKRESLWHDPKVFDTSVLIDGRVADLIELGFLKGTVVIPKFVLREIQYIADSPDPLRRAKGKRALDILQRIKKAEKVKIEIVDKDIPEIKDVDAKLVEIARMLKATLVTNDQNLVKIANFRGVSSLNINELAHVMRPPVLPGEILQLFIVKEGKEQDQGVAYLEDGTMVVVEGGRRHIGKTVDVLIHSVLQTQAGRMIFGRPKNEITQEEENREFE